MTGAGLKKCSPATRAGYRLPPAISVTDSEEVLVARIASARQAASSQTSGGGSCESRHRDGGVLIKAIWPLVHPAGARQTRVFGPFPKTLCTPDRSGGVTAAGA